jgi:Tfp pilus assembly protein PilE
MKIAPNISRTRHQAGITLIECMCYIMVFLILSSVAMGSFYLCWNHTEALLSASDDTSAALWAGERWRADVRAASGAINMETTTDGEMVKIPEGDKEIIYTFDSKRVARQAGAANLPVVLLPQVMSSDMEPDSRGGVTAWRWELQVKELRKEMHTKLMFTFEAVQKTP